ncbi:hypothetical protein M2408_005151 [Sphingobacterium sp. BIGb0165]|nr:hypothetical protein [Sphingobacterium sp. BIGb0165]
MDCYFYVGTGADRDGNLVYQMVFDCFNGQLNYKL